MAEEELQTTVGGLRAVELQYRPIREISSGRTVCWHARTQLNTPELGTLLPESFRRAAEFSGQCRKLFPLESLQAAHAVQQLMAVDTIFDWIAIHIPMRVLKDAALETVLRKTCDQYEILPGKLCVAIPPEVLTEKEGDAARAVGNLRHRGFHAMLQGFGETGCPFLELSQLPVDYVMLSPAVTGFLGKGEKPENAVKAIIDFVNNQECEPIADGVRSSAQAETLYQLGCNYCAGPLTGFYMRLGDMLQPKPEEPLRKQ